MSANNVNSPTCPQRGYPMGSAQAAGAFHDNAVFVEASAQSLRGFNDIGVRSPSSTCILDRSYVTATASAEAAYRDLRSIIEFPHASGISIAVNMSTNGSQEAAAAAAAVISASQLVSAPTSGTISQATTGGGGGGVASSSQFQRLKVEDALSYLDQVKLQFGNQPQVYNDFLDIMKEFKSQSIDTPGVISRVSNLFKGHPDLIVGFNTFLPPGFKIEVHQNEINISGPAQHSQTLAKIAQAHNSSQAAASSASSGSPGILGTSASKILASASQAAAAAAGGGVATQGTGHQPVEFNHAINYVNKIKTRFQQHPDIYKAFLEILHKYQKEQRLLKEGGGGASVLPLSESEVYSQVQEEVSSLFQNQEDLLSEFSQFLPEASAYTSSFPLGGPPATKKQAVSTGVGKNIKGTRKGSQSSTSTTNSAHSKKPKNSAKDVLAEAGKHANYAELALFDNIRKMLHNQEVYDNFLRCLMLFNEEIVSRHELIQLVTPFLGKFPDLFGSLKMLLGFKEPCLPEQLPTTTNSISYTSKERVNEFAAELDYKNLKRHGASYRALPKTYAQPKCTGRSLLCREVLNDTWVSFPMWSEDSTFEGTRKTQYEEYIFRCEDERFELDVVLELNLSTIRYLEGIQKKMAKMSAEELANFSLDASLGGHSDVLQCKAIYRIYGEKAHDVVEGMKKNPQLGISVVLKRLKAKQEEWQEAQRSFNKTWRDQLEKYYLKSLDYQGINFKQIDTRAMRSKTLIAEVEAVFDERQEQVGEGLSTTGPHLLLSLPMEKCIFDDAVRLIMYYAKIASSLNHIDALKIRSFLSHTLPDLCYYPKVEIGKDDDLNPETDSDAMDVDTVSHDGEEKQVPKTLGNGAGGGLAKGGGFIVPEPILEFADMDQHVLFANNSIYTFIRLLQYLCQRLNRIYQRTLTLISEEQVATGVVNGRGGERGIANKHVAIKLGLKKPPDLRVEEYYPTYLSMAKNFMEGNIDATTYEDTCREMFGVHAYVVFTMDRLLQNIVRQLQTLVSDDGCFRVMDCYSNFVEMLSATQVRTETRVAVETAYQKKVEALLNDENCFKIIFTKSKKVSVELLDSEELPEDSASHEMKKWQTYVEKYSCRDQEASPDLREILSKRKIFLKRSRRTCVHRASLSPSMMYDDDTNKLESMFPSMVVCGTIEFKMDKKSYRMIPLANSEDYLYNLATLNKAKQVNPSVIKRQNLKWHKWHSGWLKSQTTRSDQSKCSGWFQGVGLVASNRPMSLPSETEAMDTNINLSS